MYSYKYIDNMINVRLDVEKMTANYKKNLQNSYKNVTNMLELVSKENLQKKRLKWSDKN